MGNYSNNGNHTIYKLNDILAFIQSEIREIHLYDWPLAARHPFVIVIFNASPHPNTNFDLRSLVMFNQIRYHFVSFQLEES